MSAGLTDQRGLLLPEWKPPASLHEAASIIYRLARSIEEHSYLLGRHLLWVRDQLGTTKFISWVETETYISLRTAYRKMEFAQKCLKAQQILPRRARRGGSAKLAPAHRTYNVECPACSHNFLFSPADDVDAYSRKAEREARADMGPGLQQVIKGQGGIDPTGTSPSVVREIQIRNPGLMRDDALWAMDQMAEFLRREHPQFGIEDAATLEERLRGRLPRSVNGR